MWNRIARFMRGRYGVDELGKDLLVLAMIISLAGVVLGFFPFRALEIAAFVCSMIAVALLLIITFRALSKNINRRVLENHRYLGKTEKLRNYLRFCRVRFRDRKTYRYVKCPSCGTVCRVPKGKGKLRITCRGCRKTFEKKV